MPAASKETVLIVHGTWASPDEGAVKWYQPGQDAAAAKGEFVAKLDAELEKRGSPARCWAHCQDHSGAFCWTGHNAWIDRTNASSELAQAVNGLQAEGWRVHVIAHSHGGNVAVAALPEMNVTKENPTGFNGTMTTLGTPFIDVMTPIDKRLDRRRKIGEIAAWVSYLMLVAVFALMLLGLFEDSQSLNQFFSRNYIPVGLFIGLIVIGIFSLLHSRKRGGWKHYFDTLKAHAAARPFMLHLGSNMDEAWQLLHHLRTLESPIAPKAGLAGFVRDSHREYRLKSAEVERIHGAAPFGRQSRAAKIVAGLLLAMLPAIGGLVGLLIARPYAHQPSIYVNFLKEQGRQPSDELVKLREEWLQHASVQDSSASSKSYALYEQAVADEIAKFTPEAAAKWTVFRDQSVRNESIATASLASGLMLVFWFGLVSTGTFFFSRSFYSVVWSPFRWFGRQVRALIAIPSFIASFIVRRNAWALLQELSMGLEGYRLKLPLVDKTPAFVPEGYYTYEDMPKSAETKALAKRNEWIGHHFGDVSETFSKLVVTGADASALLRMIENDVSLVHAAYYTDDACIARIADWIASNDVVVRPSAELAQA